MKSPARKVYICNLMTQVNESLGRTAADHIRALNQHAQADIFDYAIVNNAPADADLQSSLPGRGRDRGRRRYRSDSCVRSGTGDGDYLVAGQVARHANDRLAIDLLQLASKKVHSIS